MSDHNNNPSQRFTSFRTCIPFYILYDLDLNANHLRLYGQIEQMESNPNPEIEPTFSYAWIARQLGMNRRNAMKVAKLLIEKGYIEHREVGIGQYVWNTRKAKVLVKNTNENSSSNPPGGCRTETPPSVTQRHPPGAAQSHPKIPEDKIPKDNKTYAHKTVSENAQKNLFEKFYSAYPKKKGKDKALTWFMKNNPTEEFVEMLTENINRRLNTQGEWKNLDYQFIPYASTFLNSKSWLDEICDPKKNPAK